MKIPLYKPYVGENEIEAVTRVLKSGILSRGIEAREFEAEFAKYVGKKFAVAVSNGTTGLHLGVKAFGWGSGDEVITSPYSFVSSANSLLYEGVTPVFVDIDRKSLNMDIKKIEEKITDKTRGLLLVDIWGLPMYGKELERLKKQYNLQIIEDACESVGDAVNHLSGTVSDLTVYSFYENKQITTGGEGGMITTDSEELAELCKSMSDQGRSNKPDWIQHVRLGFNYRMTEIQAAIGRVQLGKIATIHEARVQVANKYRDMLKDVDKVELPYEDLENPRSWFLYFIILPKKTDRDGLLRKLNEKEVGAKSYFVPLYNFPAYQKFRYIKKDFGVCEEIYDRVLALPMYVGLKDSEIEYIGNIIKEYFSE